MACRATSSQQPGVPREDHAVPLVLNLVADRRLDHVAVVYHERGDLDAVALVDDSRCDELVRLDGDALGWVLFVDQPDLDVVGERRLEPVHQRPRSNRAVNHERAGAATIARWEPTGQPKVGQSHRVIGVEVRQEMGVDAAQRNAYLPQPDGDAAAEVEQQFLRTGLDQRALAEAIGPGGGRTRSQQGHPHSPAHASEAESVGGATAVVRKFVFIDVSLGGRIRRIRCPP
jgi:hypothetical protein